MEESVPTPIIRNVARIAGSTRTFLRSKSAIAGPGSRTELEDLRRRLDEVRRENAGLRARLVARGEGAGAGLIAPERIVWSFGSGRTGSSWLNAMLREPENHVNWGEPLVGKLFADLYYSQTGELNRENMHFIMSEPLKEVWLRSIRSFVLEGATARFPEVAEQGYLMVTDPNGSVGAPLIMGALPESRMVLLVRDPRDVVASFLDASRSGSWLNSWGGGKASLADDQPDLFVRQRANSYMAHMGKTKEAYDAHPGRKVRIRYEDLRTDTLGAMRRLYSTLEIPVGAEGLAEAVERHSWENLPAAQKGSGKFFRKAMPGGWREDLTSEQARIVEKITAPILEEFYSG